MLCYIAMRYNRRYMDETARIEQDHRDKIARAANVPVSEVTPTTGETPLEIVVEKTTEGADVVRNMAEEGGSLAFGGSTTEVRPSNQVLGILKKKLAGRLKPGEQIEEK